MWTDPLIKDNILSTLKVYSSYKVIMPHVIKSPSFLPSVSSILWGVSSILRATAGWCYSTEGQEATSPGNTSLPFQLFIFFIFFSPLPVIISHSVLSCTLPVTETAALEEQVAAGHRANLTRLLKPDGARKKKRETNEAAPKGRKSRSMNSKTLTVPSLERICSWYDHAVGAWRYAIFAFCILEQKQKED